MIKTLIAMGISTMLSTAMGENCGHCYGCMKTMMPLDLLGKLYNFSGSFDLDGYYRNSWKYTQILIYSSYFHVRY